MSVTYDHRKNRHSILGPSVGFPYFCSGLQISSVLDVGCGQGTWLKAAMDHGVQDVYGIDGVDVPAEELYFDKRKFECRDLTKDWSLGRVFDLVLCLEVAEHLSQDSSRSLVRNLVKHSNRIIFSAAVPGQVGQNHINCQWPFYWQTLFNQEGFACDDSIRWRIWDLKAVEPWYRQNLFIAERSPDVAGSEARIRSVIHPDMIHIIRTERYNSRQLGIRGLIRKVARRVLPGETA